MSSRGVLAVSALEYKEAGGKARGGLHLVERQEESVAIEQVRREMHEARERLEAETGLRIEREVAEEREATMRQVADALERFAQERSRYFAGVEQEVVGLALGIARKILQRESELDPALLAALVRIGLERMEAGSEVRVRVSPIDAERWRGLAEASSWEVVGDATLAAGDCVVETALGKANFGFEAQMADVEQTLRQLLAQRPGAA